MHAWLINCLRQHASSGSASRGMVQHGTAMLLLLTVENFYLAGISSALTQQDVITHNTLKLAKSLQATIQ